MEKRKIESLRDLAIAHFPKARAKRAQAVRYNGNRFADSGLQSAYSWGEDGEATAIEKQASELLQLTFMHPDALPLDPHTWDAAKDAETIAIKSHTLEMALEMQPQLEAAMLSAARLLCELAGVALPPWVDAADAPAAKVEAGVDASPSGDGVEEQAAAADDHDETLAALFNPVPVEALEKMFPAGGKWKSWAEKAASNGLKNARTERAKFNPYIAAVWFMGKGITGWDLAHCNRVLVNNLPARSRDDAHLLTGGID